MLRRNGRVKHRAWSVVRPEESLWRERFVKEVGLEPGVKKSEVTDGESGELPE